MQVAETQTIERKVCDLSEVAIKAGENGHGRISGYAATFGNKDRQGDVIMPGAFKDGIETFKRDGFIAVGHDHGALPVAMPSVVREDSKGLYLEADFHSTPEAQAARTVAQERIAAGKSVSFSIGYAVPEGGAEHTKGARRLHKLDTYEVSLVNIPANPLALVAGVKGDGLDDGLAFTEHLEAVVDAVKGVTERAEKRAELRTKEGRVLSAANVAKLAALLEALGGLDSVKATISDLVEAAQPRVTEQADTDPGKSADEVRALKLRIVQSMAVLRGAPTTTR